MKLLFLSIMAFLFCMASSQTVPHLWFIYLVNGDGPRPADKKELERMQVAHIDNFKRQFAKGKLIAAGPVDDPTGFRRGIVVLTVASEAEVLSCFDTDPYVQNKIMALQIHPWSADRKTINTDLPNPSAMEENRLVTIKLPKKPSASLLRRQANYLTSATGKKAIAVAGEFVNANGYEAVVLVHGTDETLAREVLQKSPLMAEGGATLEFIPLWMSKGVLS